MSADSNYLSRRPLPPEEHSSPSDKQPAPAQIQLAPRSLSAQHSAPDFPAPQSISQVPVWMGSSPSPTLSNPARSNPERTFQHAQTTFRSVLGDHVTPLRLAGHISVLVVAAIVLLISQASLPSWDFSLRALPDGVVEDANTAAVAGLGEASGPSLGLNALKSAAIPFTEIRETLQEPLAEAAPAEAIRLYKVEKGDTVLGIADKFGLTPETVQWANPRSLRNADRLQIGAELAIPPVDGVLHTVTNGDTLSKLASSYGVDVENIIAYVPNGIQSADANLAVGAQIMVPDGVRRTVTQPVVQTYTNQAVPTTSRGSGNFEWPTPGSVSQGSWSGHVAVDISSWTGATVVAADGGVVRLATGGWNGGYGQHVIIDHGNGFQTLYAHLNAYWVNVGESVAQGTPIGSVGNTGNSTGPHLHFEVRYQGVRRNPINYLQR